MNHLAILASHGGSILQAVIDACEAGTLAAEVVLVISNNSESQALARAAGQRIETLHLSAHTHPEPDLLDRAMRSAFDQAKIDWVILAGYMKRLGKETLSAYQHRIINTHPSLLPKYGGQGFFGRKVHQAVMDAGDTESGATVHFVKGDYDTGPIVSQVRVPVQPKDSVEALEERVKTAERQLIVNSLMELIGRKEAAGY